MPTMPDYPPRLEDARSDRSAVSMTALVRPFNLSGHPAASIPIASTEAGPIALQIIGRQGDDETVLEVGRMIAASWPKPAAS